MKRAGNSGLASAKAAAGFYWIFPLPCERHIMKLKRRCQVFEETLRGKQRLPRMLSKCESVLKSAENCGFGLKTKPCGRDII
jgi:hypothetical protein